MCKRTQSMTIPLPKKGSPKLCKNYRTISFISNPNKVMRRVLLNRNKQKFLSEQQAGFQSRKSISEDILNIVCCLRNISNINGTYTKTLKISQRPFIESDMKAMASNEIFHLRFQHHRNHRSIIQRRIQCCFCK